jgi:hypothetical protein
MVPEIMERRHTITRSDAGRPTFRLGKLFIQWVGSPIFLLSNSEEHLGSEIAAQPQKNTQNTATEATE